MLRAEANCTIAPSVVWYKISMVYDLASHLVDGRHEVAISNRLPVQPPSSVSVSPTGGRWATSSLSTREAHAMIERALRDMLIAVDVPVHEVRRAGSAVGLARLAHRRELISEETIRGIQGVSVLRKLAAHGSAREITTDQASEYLAVVDAILFALRAAHDS